jgi:integrase
MTMAKDATKRKPGRTRRYFGNIFQRPGREGFYVMFRFGGKRYCRMAGLTKTDAENYVLELARKIKSGQFEVEERRREEIRFEVFAERHLKHLQAEHADTTYANEEKRFEKVLIPHFRGKLLSEITEAHIEKFMLKLAEQGRSPATRNRYQVYLSRLFQRATVHGYVEGNPAAKIKRLREEERAVPALDIATQNALVAACDEKIRDYVLLSLDTGCRQGELLRLEWKDVDLDRGELAVLKSKSGKSRRVPLTGRLAARLREMKDARVIPLEGPDRVLPHLPMPLSGPTAKLFKKAAAAIGYPDLRPHDARHLCAVNLARAGVPLVDIGRWLGHSPQSVTVTLRYARHCPEDAAQRARVLLEGRLAAGT